LSVSVHTIVSLDLLRALFPGGTHDFSSYFVAGALYSGFAMVLVLVIPIRRFYGLEDCHRPRGALQNMAKVMLASGLVVAYGYLMEIFLRLVQRR